MIKVSYYWTQLSSRVMGWSENFWGIGDNVTSTVESAAFDLYSKLYAIKGKQTASLGYRMSVWNDDGTPTRVSRLWTPNVVNGTNPNVSVGTTSDYPTVAMLLQADGGNPARSTRQWIRGLWDDAVVEGGRIAPGINPQQRNQILNTLAGGIWGMRSRVQTGNPKIVIDDFDAETDTFLTSINHGFTVNQRVSLSGLKTSPELTQSVNGIYTISAVPALNEFRLAGYNIPTGITVIVGTKAKVQRVQFAVFTARWDFVRITSRQAGRPFGSPSGRPKKTRR